MSHSLDVDTIVEALRDCLPAELPVGLHEPEFAGDEWAYVKECLDTGWVSTAGSYVDRFETDIAEYAGLERAVAVVNGTAGLQVALRIVGVEAGDEVLVPALTFVATANAVSYCGATPHFVDSAPNTLGLDPDKLAAYLDDIVQLRDGAPHNRRTGRRLQAVVPVHTFGHPVDLEPLVRVADRYGLAVVEDAAEALGTTYKDRHVGHAGDAAVLSFNGNKTITTGGGGAILTNDEALADDAHHLTTVAKKDHPWKYDHDRVGYNYRLPNLNAALGCAQLEQMPSFLERKRTLAARYRDAFAEVSGVTVFEEPDFARSNYWLNTLLLDDELADRRDAVLERTNEEGFGTRPAWTLMPELPMYADCPRMDLSVAEDLERRIVNVPSSATLAPLPAHS